MNVIHNNYIWELVELPKGKKIIGCKWVSNVKLYSTRTLERNKVKVVAKEYAQTYRIDYQETFALVAKINTIRVMLSFAVNLDWSLLQLNVKNVFLHGELTMEMYMDPPPMFSTKKEGMQVEKSLIRVIAII